MKNPYNKINKDMECLKNENCIPIIIGTNRTSWKRW